MDDDFNTARAMGILFEAVRNLNRRIDQQGAENACLSPEGRAGIGDMIKIGNVLGLMAETPENYFQARKQAVIESQEIDPQWVEEKIRQRADARKAKDFALADQIRDQLQALNIILEDRPEGTIWKHGDGKT
jgi:cysteinyl-tRNA synthetase